ncbi:MAG: GAF domain-containing protein [Neisseriaceae bacterium]|nr:GAF domain-containing protein [Neisseriaceae bacterium]MBP6863085.1 GAF domain-containing protein [Neisseriaceae bacterium]
MSTFQAGAYEGDLTAQYAQLAQQLQGLLTGEGRVMTLLSQASALLNQFLSDVNWVGFYLAEGETLYLGPFQGLPACSSIDFRQGVCGAAARTQMTQRVADVHAFVGHIACDVRSRAEVVVPIVVQGQIWGVLDVDSPSVNRFSAEDQLGLEHFVAVLQPFLAEAVQ